MIFTPTAIDGSYIIRPDLRKDDRGLFARVWCQEEFGAQGIASSMVQANVSRTAKKGTVRGFHYQIPPREEAKLVRCSRGAIFDVILDLRPESSTYRRWWGKELIPDQLEMIYIPQRCAHGYQSLEENTEVTYLTSEPYAPLAEQGIRYDDPAFEVRWPLTVGQVSEKDRAWPDFKPSVAV